MMGKIPSWKPKEDFVVTNMLSGELSYWRDRLSDEKILGNSWYEIYTAISPLHTLTMQVTNSSSPGEARAGYLSECEFWGFLRT